jgi:integrase
MATIIKRPGPKNSLVWQAQVRKKGYPSQIKTFDRKGDAQKWAKMTEHQMEVGLWRNTKEASQIILSQALERYLTSVTPRKRPSTQKSEQLSARSLREFMGNLSLLQVTPEKVAGYRDKRLKSVSANTVRIELALLSNLFNTAEREWSFHGLDNPVRHVHKPKIPEGRCPSLSEEQINLLLEECRKSYSKLLYPFVLLALHTGCRSMELRKLRWPQVFLEKGHISLVGSETKIHRSRIVPLTPAAQEILQSLRTNGHGKKVVDIHGNPIGLVFPAQVTLTNPEICTWPLIRL